MRAARGWSIAGIILGLALTDPAVAEFSTENFVSFQRGELPILLTAPHGGAGEPPGVSERTLPSGNKSSDTLTAELTREVAAALEDLLGARPYVVIAEFQRKFIDANRADTFVPGNAASLAANESYNDADARPVYQGYHGKIREFIDEIHDDFTVAGVLLDIHGQGRFPSTAYRGSKDGNSACSVVDQHGEAALAGPDSIVGRLAAQGYDVFPPVNAPLGDPTESTGGLNGGHTVSFYGTCSGGLDPEDIDAIQIENGSHLRNPANRADYARALANAVGVFYAAFLDPSFVLPPLLTVPRADDLPGLITPGTGGLGAAVAVGDFNRDGLADVAAGKPGANAVRVFYGHAQGITSVGSEDLRPDSAGGAAQAGDEFGAALAAGDFNHDGFSDLAIGSPGDDQGALDAGTVVVVYGSAEGLVEDQDGPAFAFERLSQTQVDATAEAGDRFGTTLVGGDFDGNGIVDLAVGVPDEDDDAADDGMVVVFSGSKTFGLVRLVGKVERAVAFERLSQAHAGATNEAGDRFGAALAAGDFDDNGITDLAVGVPDENDEADDDGIVVVFYGSSRGLIRTAQGVPRAVSFERLAQNQVAATPERGDHFGFALAAGDFNGNGVDDLAVGVPDEDDEVEDDGLVVVFYGAKTQGLLRVVKGSAKAVSFERLGQRHAGAKHEDGDRFGAALAAADFNGNGVTDLAVGVPDEFDRADGDGMVIAFQGSATNGLLRVVKGTVTAVAARRLSQVSLAMASEAGDRFGAAIGAGDTNGDGRADLAVGAPGEDVSGAADVGALYLRRGTSGGL